MTLEQIDAGLRDLLNEAGKFPIVFGDPSFATNRMAVRSVLADREWLAKFRADYLIASKMLGAE
jgi:hypothetical protein